MIKEFKQFINKGNILDLAVGVVIGTSFTKIVSSLVNDILTPLLGMALGGLDFSSLSITIGDSIIKYGSFIQNIIDFLIIAFCIFIIIKIFNKLEENREKIKLKLTKKEIKEQKKEEIKKDENIILLEEIRDLLKNKK